MSLESVETNQQIQNSNMSTLAQEIDSIFTEKLQMLNSEGDSRNKQSVTETILREWISTLQTTNQDLIETFNKLETEAYNRLNLLSIKLMQTKEKFNTSLLHEDLRSLLEVVRRVREEKSWSAEGLQFHTITYEDVYGPLPPDNCEIELISNDSFHTNINVELTRTTNDKDSNILHELQIKDKEIEQLRKDLQVFIATELENREQRVEFPEQAILADQYSQVVHENEDFKQQLANLKLMLEEKDQKVQENYDDKMALIAEIADKHGDYVKQRSVITDLETSLRFSKMKLDKKEEIIEQLNTDLKKLEMLLSPAACNTCCCSAESKYAFTPPSPDSSGEKVCSICTIDSCVNVPLNKKISIESLSYDPASTSSDGQVSPVQNLMKDLKQEIEAKDLLLKDKTEMISCLECQIADREKVIRELKKRNELSDEEQRTSDEMVLHLRKAVTAHAESIKFLLKEKEHFENDVASLQEQLRAMDESTIKLSEEKKQLENELKRSGDLVETLNFNISIISDQLSDCYNENMYKERQLVLLKDSNVELRGDIYKLQQDFQVMRDILQVQSYKSQVRYIS